VSAGGISSGGSIKERQRSVDLLATIKLVIGITGTDKDELLAYYLNAAKDRLGADASDFSIVQSAIMLFNKRGIEGAVSHSSGDVVTNWGANAFDTSGGAGGGSQSTNIIPWPKGRNAQC
jgi:hypothetical protein